MAEAERGQEERTQHCALAENDCHFSERKALKVSEHKILKYILKKKKEKKSQMIGKGECDNEPRWKL